MCNAEIKFKAFLDHAVRIGADYIATGHYARVRKANNKFELLKAVDSSKDQSYFLHRLNQAQLSKTLFPLGEIHKLDVRKIAQQLKLPNANKKDSTGICFIGERPFREFLNRYLARQPGPIKTPEGKLVGQHIGLSFYTIGQRKGIGIGGIKNLQNADGCSDAWYVARKDMINNTLYVAQGHGHPWLLSHTLIADQASWIAGTAPDLNCLMAKTRYRQTDVAAQLDVSNENQFQLAFTNPQWAVTPGQHAVLYQGDVCLGGGVIGNFGH
jgi:tRNA-specific 2-thiouridylase